MLILPLYVVCALFGVTLLALGTFSVIPWLKKPKALPAAPAPLALPEPAPAPAPPPPTRFELAGIAEACCEPRSWQRPSPVRVQRPRHYIFLNGERYDVTRKDGTADPKLLGLFIADTSLNGYHCGYCRYSVIGISQVVRRSPPPGAEDLGLAECVPVARYCRKCGLRHGAFQMATPPEPFQDLENLHDILKLMAADNGKLTKQIRLDMLSEEYARVQPRACEIAREMDRLHAEIRPRTDLDPYRGLPLAKPDDPPDDRARAMPALTGTD